MADYGSAQSPKINYRQLTSSIFSSFSGFTSKGCNETESIMSPTSTLDAKPFSSLKNPFWPNTSTPKTPKPESRTPFEKLDSRGLVDALIDDKSESGPSKSSSRMVLFGSKLKIQVPNAVSPNESPKSPVDFGIKTRNSHLGPFSPGLSASPARKSPFGSLSSGLSASEMELSEDYTCVISYGPNPRTTHIFDDCVVESCCGVVKFSESRRENNMLFSDRSMSYPSESFLSFCYNCKRNLGQGKDIYMYRGEKAFCSSECRYREMMLEEDGLKSPEIDDIYCASS